MVASIQLMLIPASASSISARSAEMNARFIRFVFGSLSRPPETCLYFISWRSFSDLYQSSFDLSAYYTRLSSLWEELKNCYVFLQLKSLVCEVDVMMLMNFGGLRVIAHHVAGLVDDLNANVFVVTIMQSLVIDPMKKSDAKQNVRGTKSSTMVIVSAFKLSLVIGFQRMGKLSPLLIVVDTTLVILSFYEDVTELRN